MSDGRMASVALMAQEAASLSTDAGAQLGDGDNPELRAALDQVTAAAIEAARLAGLPAAGSTK
jgi:hypothetical protein